LLLLDDDAAVVEFLDESLTARGFDVTPHTVPEAALAALQESDFDLMITDLHMPGMRGTDILSSALRCRPSQLVLLMTAFGSIDLAVAAVRAGACDFIAKPFKIEALVLAIERAFRERQMRKEIVRLRARGARSAPGGVVAESDAMRRVVSLAHRVADLGATVLLTGETGTGKGAVARLIHEAGARKKRPFQHVNCAAVPAALIESELFGVRRGAFTDAREDRQGAFLAAGDGTLFLDEIGELSLETQAKLLTALDVGTVRPLGGTQDVPLRARVIAATNRSLESLLRDGAFRPDLYYRLNVVRIDIPPLRERRDDILPLVDSMLAVAREDAGRPILGLSNAAVRCLLAYQWPGNVRELFNVLERAIALTDHDALVPEDFGLPGSGSVVDAALTGSAGRPLTLDELERAYARQVLASRGGNKAETARTLGVNRRTLYRMLADDGSDSAT
jgi:DNA-binding NtrC family response regulator